MRAFLVCEASAPPSSLRNAGIPSPHGDEETHALSSSHVSLHQALSPCWEDCTSSSPEGEGETGGDEDVFLHLCFQELSDAFLYSMVLSCPTSNGWSQCLQMTLVTGMWGLLLAYV